MLNTVMHTKKIAAGVNSMDRVAAPHFGPRNPPIRLSAGRMKSLILREMLGFVSVESGASLNLRPRFRGTSRSIIAVPTYLSHGATCGMVAPVWPLYQALNPCVVEG